MDILQVINGVPSSNSNKENTKTTKEKTNTSEKFSLDMKKAKAKNAEKSKGNEIKSNKATEKVNIKEEEVTEEVSKMSSDGMAAMLELLKALLAKGENFIDQVAANMSSDNMNSIASIMELLEIDTEILNQGANSETLDKELLEFLKNQGNFDEILGELNIPKDSLQGQDIISKLQNLRNIIENNNENVALSTPEADFIEQMVNSSKANNSFGEEMNSEGNKATTLDESLKAANNKSEETGSKEAFISKEDSLLEKLTKGEQGEEKVTRVNDYISILNRNIDTIGTAAVDEPIVMTKSNLNNDVIKAITYMDQNEIKDLTVKIYPKELGEVTISVVMEQGALKAMVKATSKEAVDLLAAGLGEINDKISSQNIKIESVNIGLYEHDTTYFADQQKGFNENNKNSDGKGTNVQGEVDIEEESSTSNNSSGAINILI